MLAYLSKYSIMNLMIKVLPLLIVPPLFLMLFLNVENLTVKLEDKFTIDQTSESNDSEVFQNERDDEFIISEENLGYKNHETKVDESSNDFKPALIERNETILEKDLNDDKNKPSNNKIPEIKSKPIQIISDSSLRIQFGAFSKLKNAEIQKLKILKLMSKKFPNFEKKFRVLEENNLFKLIYSAENSFNSKSICDYSKSIKINCLILKK
mgnify:CR=1 FL=1|tara:strand:- start:234 stop:863 length:630 start_codon:yes stop_codon:yes gene_type:complete